MATVKMWLASAALVGGVGGAAAGLAAPDGHAQSASAPRPSAAAPDAGYLQQQIDSLLEEDRALERAVSQARQRLAIQVHASERSLAVLHRRIVAVRRELKAARAAGSQASSIRVAAPAARPSSHATTGASGAGSGRGEDGEHEGGGDD